MAAQLLRKWTKFIKGVLSWMEMGSLLGLQIQAKIDCSQNRYRCKENDSSHVLGERAPTDSEWPPNTWPEEDRLQWDPGACISSGWVRAWWPVITGQWVPSVPSLDVLGKEAHPKIKFLPRGQPPRGQEFKHGPNCNEPLTVMCSSEFCGTTSVLLMDASRWY